MQASMLRTPASSTTMTHKSPSSGASIARAARAFLYASAAAMMGVERRYGQDQAYTEIVDAIRVHSASANGHRRTLAANRLLGAHYQHRRSPAQSWFLA